MPGKCLLWPWMSKYATPKINLRWIGARLFYFQIKWAADDQVSFLLLLFLDII